MPAVDPFGAAYVDTLGQLCTYNATAVAKTPVASATEPFFTIQGSATATIYVCSIDFAMKDATGAATEADVILFRFSAMSGGTAATALSPSVNDTLLNPTATATVQYWTTLNTSVTANGGAAAAIQYANFTSAAAVVPPMPYTFYFGQNGQQAFVLRGTSDWLGLCISAVGTTPLVDISVTWIEKTAQ